jgi:hypothetical protein
MNAPMMFIFRPQNLSSNFSATPSTAVSFTGNLPAVKGPTFPAETFSPYNPNVTLLLTFRWIPRLEPVAFADSSYAGLLCIGEHHSISGIIIYVGVTVIFAKTGIQKTTTLSSTEAEVIAGCAAGKIVKYFRKIFTDLPFPLTRPTPVGEDNVGTILISNHNRPSGRTRHPDIPYFASQEWVQLRLMKYFKICGTVNPADTMSKIIY